MNDGNKKDHVIISNFLFFLPPSIIVVLFGVFGMYEK